MITTISCKVKQSGNYFIHTSVSFPKVMLEQLQRLDPWTLQKECAGSSDLERRMWRRIVNKRDDCVNKNKGGERREGYKAKSYLLIGYMK